MTARSDKSEPSREKLNQKTLSDMMAEALEEETKHLMKLETEIRHKNDQSGKSKEFDQVSGDAGVY